MYFVKFQTILEIKNLLPLNNKNRRPIAFLEQNAWLGLSFIRPSGKLILTIPASSEMPSTLYLCMCLSCLFWVWKFGYNFLALPFHPSSDSKLYTSISDRFQKEAYNMSPLWGFEPRPQPASLILSSLEK